MRIGTRRGSLGQQVVSLAAISTRPPSPLPPPPPLASPSRYPLRTLLLPTPLLPFPRCHTRHDSGRLEGVGDDASGHGHILAGQHGALPVLGTQDKRGLVGQALWWWVHTWGTFRVVQHTEGQGDSGGRALWGRGARHGEYTGVFNRGGIVGQALWSKRGEGHMYVQEGGPAMMY